jgi:hypothetical protein
VSDSLYLPTPSPEYDARDQAQMRSAIEQCILRVSESIDTLKVRPRVQDILITFNDGGRAFITIKCNEDAIGFRYALAVDAAPADETVRAAPLILGTEGDFTEEGPFQAGDTLYVAVFPYAGRQGDQSDGTEGPLYVQAVTRGARATNEVRAYALALTPETLTVEVVAASDVGMPAIELESLTGAATIASGLGVGEQGDSPQQWVFSRPAAGAGDSIARFRATFPDAADDSDQFVIPDRTTDAPIFLASRARILTIGATEIVVRYAVADPIPQGADTVDITTSLSAAPGLSISPATTQTVTPAAFYSGAEGTFVDFTVHRPFPGEATGLVTFSAESNAAARVPDQDVVHIPAQDVVPAWLDVDMALGDEEATFTYDGLEPIEFYIEGEQVVPTPASPFTVPRGAVSGGSDKVCLFRTEGPLGDVASQTIIVPKKPPFLAAQPRFTSSTISAVDAPGDGGGQFDLAWTTADTVGGETVDVRVEFLSGDPITTLNPGYPTILTGLTSGDTILWPIGSNATVRLVLVMRDSFGEMIAERTHEQLIS